MTLLDYGAECSVTDAHIRAQNVQAKPVYKHQTQ